MALSTGEIVLLVVGALVVSLLLFYLAFATASWFRARRSGKVKGVPVDLAEYQGRWFEIARYPKWFEKGCSQVTADYAWDPKSGTMEVVNRCFTEDRGWKVRKGTAVPTGSDGSLAVSFFPGFYGNYTVAYRESDLAVVTNQEKSSLWLLSRKPKLGRARAGRMMDWLRRNGFDTTRLYMTPQEKRR